MADTKDSKSFARKGVPVQVRGPVVVAPQGVASSRKSLQIAGSSLFLAAPCESLRTLAAPDFAPAPGSDATEFAIVPEPVRLEPDFCPPNIV